MAPVEEVQEKNPRGIPKAPFIVSLGSRGGLAESNVRLIRFLEKCQSDVEGYVGGPDGDVESALRGVQDALAYVAFCNVI